MLILPWLIATGGLYVGGKLVERYRHFKNGQDKRQDQAPAPPEPDPPADAEEIPQAVALARPVHRRVSLLSRSRQQHLELMSADRGGDKKPDAEEQELRSDLAISGVSFALVAGGLFVPALHILAAPVMIYGAARLWSFAYEAWKRNEPIGMTLLDATVVSGALLFGPWLAPASAFLSSSVARYLVRLTKKQSTARVSQLFDQQQHQVWTLREGVHIQIPLAEVMVGDIVIVDAGTVIPIDGVVVSGIARVDQQALTGESQPSEKAPGDPVMAASMVLEGRLQVRVSHAGGDTLAARLIEILNKSQEITDEARSRGQRLIDACSLPTLGLGLATAPILGIVPGLAVMESSVGASLRYSGPISILNYLQIASEMGVLIKDGHALEHLTEIDTVVFDKTGTLTRDRPVLGAVFTFAGHMEDEVLALAAAAEQNQEHPIARAIREAAATRGLRIPHLEAAAVHPGRGLSVRIDGHRVLVGSLRLLATEGVEWAPPVDRRSRANGSSLVFVVVDGIVAGALEFFPEIRPEAKALVDALHARRIHVAIISGDSIEPTRSLATRLGIDTFHAEVLPEQKSTLVQQLRSQGRNICYVGDGINDALALRAANVSISLRGATTVATDAASIVLMSGDLSKLSPLFEIADEFASNMKMNTAITIAPAAISLFGVYFFGFGIAAANAFYNLSMLLGLINGMLPAAKLRDFGSPSPIDIPSDLPEPAGPSRAPERRNELLSAPQSILE